MTKFYGPKSRKLAAFTRLFLKKLKECFKNAHCFDKLKAKKNSHILDLLITKKFLKSFIIIGQKKVKTCYFLLMCQRASEAGELVFS